MHNPFPGMNPYLEQPGLWPQVHNRLIVAIADDITPQVAPRYLVSIEERVYASTEATPLIGIADVAVTRLPTTASSITTAVPGIAPRRVQVPLPMEVTERFLAVRLVQTNEVVCVIEILSPANKRSGDGRRAYETKRQKILGSATNLVEIDLLRGGVGMAVAEPPQKTYSILVSASGDRPNAELYEFDLADSIPSFPVPLQPNDAVPVVDLQRLLNEVYTRARFDLAIDYHQPLQPVISSQDAAWVQSLLATVE
jgi:hypothetical protein